MLLVLFLGGKTVDLFQAYIQNTGGYISDLVNKTFNLYAYEPKDPKDWIGGWTILYWGWWLSWSPFVGMFIARIGCFISTSRIHTMMDDNFWKYCD